jgi:hypothetical protein
MDSNGKCPGCPTVPVVSRELGAKVLARKSQKTKEQCLVRAMAWLTERHEGIGIYAGICGRPYTNDEKNAIATETGAVSGLPCPFLEGDQCVLGGLGPHYNPHEEGLRGQPYAFLPAVIAKTYDPDGLYALMRHGVIADAKVALLTRNKAFVYKDDEGNVLVG